MLRLQAGHTVRSSQEVLDDFFTCNPEKKLKINKQKLPRLCQIWQTSIYIITLVLFFLPQHFQCNLKKNESFKHLLQLNVFKSVMIYVNTQQ